MARCDRLEPGEHLTCGYCDGRICEDNGDSLYAVVGEQEEPWHVECADSIGIPVEDPEEHDEDYDYDPDYDGPEDDEVEVAIHIRRG